MNSTEKKPIEFINLQTGTLPSMPDDPSVAIIEHINRKIAALETLAEIIDFLFINIQKLIPCDRIAVSFFEEGGRRLTINHVKTNYENIHLKDGYSAEMGTGSLSTVFNSGNPRIINNLKRYLETHPASDTTKLLLMEGINSSITCPLSVEGRSVGLLFISSKQIDIYNRGHLAIQLLIIERLGQAVEKTWRIEQLSEAINSYMEMLGFVSHELKSPLDSIISLGTTLAEGYFGKLEDKHRDYVLRMVSKARYLRDMTSEYLTLSRFESNSIRLAVSEVKILEDIVDESVDIILPQAEEKGIRLILPVRENDITIECDPALIKIVVNNLLSNAVKYGNEGGTVTVKISVSGNSMELSVRNTGPGFPAEAKQKLFRKFSRIEKAELMSRKGTGVGLYSSWKIIQLHNGTINAESVENEWAEFSFTIPVLRES